MNALPKQSALRRWLPVGILTGLLVAMASVLAFDRLRSPMALYREAEQAPVWRAAMLYDRLSQELPHIAEYFHLARARQKMPEVEAIADLQALIAWRPHSPVAYEAYLILARYYSVNGETNAAEEAYRAALAIEESASLRVELARYLAEIGDTDDAYAEFKLLLPDQPDAFAAMRRYGADPLSVAADLEAAAYFSDVLETLADINSEDSNLLRAKALASLDRGEEASALFKTWLAHHPDDQAVQLALADTLAELGQTDEALSLYQKIDTPEAQLGEADLLVDSDPEAALALYRKSEDPIAWWKAAGILEEQGQQQSAIGLYEQVAESGNYLSDDAAYRMLVLARQEENTRAEQKAADLLAAQGMTYLELRARQGDFTLPYTPAYHSTLPDVLVARVAELEQVGLEEFALRELRIAAEFERRPEVIAAAAQALAERGKTVEAYRIASQLLVRNPRRPLAIWRLAYPKPYADLVVEAAEKADVDPLLVWAMMRQESEFDPEAKSFANAQGLMQIIPPTRDSIAERLGETVASDEMFKPATNIRYGAAYIGWLLQDFGGDVELAVMGYNGGPGNVAEWLKDPKFQDSDGRYRWVGFGETREYMVRVMMNYAVYQELERLEKSGG